jgi:hypothetical protein
MLPVAKLGGRKTAGDIREHKSNRLITIAPVLDYKEPSGPAVL